MWITNKNSHWTQPLNKLGLWVTWVDRDASSDNDVQCDLDQRFTRNAAFLKICNSSRLYDDICLRFQIIKIVSGFRRGGLTILRGF